MIFCAFLLALGAEASFAEGNADRFVGTWVLDARNSHDLGGAPSSMVIIMTAVEGGVHYRSQTGYSNNRVRVAEYTALYDGSVSMVTGLNGVLAPVSLRRVNANLVQASYFSGMQVVARSDHQLTVGGRMMTITTTYRAPQGGRVKSVAVFKRLATASRLFGLLGVSAAGSYSP
jgi:hypothetical protein